MEIKSDSVVAVLGVGTMGPGIALGFAQAGFEVRLYGRNKERCAHGLQAVRAALASCREHGLIREDEDTVMARLQGVADLKEACRGVELVVEALPENLELKKRVFSQLDRLCPSQAILASNTSGLSITAMGAATARPHQVVGTHFWNPPHLLPLVEVVRGQKTSDRTMERAARFMKAIGKRPVMVHREVPGFIGTRLHQALIREAFHIVEQGIASMEDVDTVVKCSFGRRLAVTGPFETCDLGGLDVFLAAAEVWKHLSNAGRPSDLLADKVKQGHLGAKTGRGFFEWDSRTLARVRQERERELIRYLRKDLGLPEEEDG